MLLCAGQAAPAVERVDAGRYADDDASSTLQGADLRGRTLGIVGFGRIGRRVGEICALGFGMRVLVHDPFAGDVAVQYQWAEAAASLDDLLARSDFVTPPHLFDARDHAPHRRPRAGSDAPERLSDQREPWSRGR